MYIKQVSVTGFRSYRDKTTVESFSPAHNVIVGRNGSGKSNFFYAIQFVLSDEFSNLRQEQRQALLHEGTGPRVIQASVEIIFDNSDQRLPMDRDEVVLERVIGAKKDQYFLDKKQVTKSEVMSLFEAAGFSRSNPYYIVKQGKINELATAADPMRLKLLREVAGTRVYDERKEESKSILADTESKRDKIDNLLKYIDERLNTLEEETKELREYQKVDKMRRSVEYTIYDHELREARRKLDDLAQKRDNSSAQSSSLYEQQQSASDEILRINRKLREIKQFMATLDEEREQLTQEQSSLFQQKTKLELQIKDLREDVEGERSSRHIAEDELTEVCGKIHENEEKLDELRPKFDSVSLEEERVNQEKALAEMRKKELFAKQGRKVKFANVEERDRHINRELKQLSRQITEHEDRIAATRQELHSDTDRIKELEGNFSEATGEMETQRERIEQLNRQVTEMKQIRDSLQGQRQDLWRKESQLTQEIANSMEELQGIDQQLRSKTGKGVMQGIDSIRTILKNFEQEGRNDDILSGYHGTLMQNFTCGQKFFTAVEVTAGNRLFYHIVDTDRIATKLLSEMNRHQLKGECNFIPLNRIDGRPSQYPDNANAVPMIDQLEYDKEYEKAFRHIFGKTLIVRNMETGTSLAKMCQLDCITLEGDQVSYRGALTGGFYDSRRTRLELQQHRIEKERLIKDKEAELTIQRTELTRLDCELTNNINDISRTETRVQKMRETYDRLRDTRKDKKDNLQSLQDQRGPKERHMHQTISSIQQFKAHKQALEAELGTDLLSQLTQSEQDEVKTLEQRIDLLQVESKQLFTERTKIQSEVNKLENVLKTNLYKKKEELNSKLQEIVVEDQRNLLEELRQELKRKNDRISQISDRLAEVQEDHDGYMKEHGELTSQLEEQSQKETEAREKIADDTKELDKIASKSSILLKKKEECMKKIRDLGSLPSEAFDKYQGLSVKKLFKLHEGCAADLKKYENVNKKALDQFVSFSDQKEKLTKRKEELDKAEKSIEDLIIALDQRKYDAIQLTFKQVSKYFTQVFNKLVPNGHGQLVMKKSDDSQPDSELEPIPLVEQFTGVGIKVSFTGGDDSEMREMQQLSGGQKSLVALAMIFAIQRCDPAPFYLFDEIDAALDAQHRKAVADMIHELCNDAQFITTTFRPELLEHADRYFGVLFRSKVSHIEDVTKDKAFDFVEDDQAQA